MIVREKGKHFDPDIVQAFLLVEDTFQVIAGKFQDNDVSARGKTES